MTVKKQKKTQNSSAASKAAKPSKLRSSDLSRHFLEMRTFLVSTTTRWSDLVSHEKRSHRSIFYFTRLRAVTPNP